MDGACEKGREWPAETALRRAVDGLQIRYDIKLSAEEYVGTKAWRNARLESCPFLRLMQQRAADALPSCRRSDARVNGSENVHGGLVDAHRPKAHPHVPHETTAAPGKLTLMRDLLERGPSPTRAAEACIKQVGDGRVQRRVRRIDDRVLGELHATSPAPS